MAGFVSEEKIKQEKNPSYIEINVRFYKIRRVSHTLPEGWVRKKLLRSQQMLRRKTALDELFPLKRVELKYYPVQLYNYMSWGRKSRE